MRTRWRWALLHALEHTAIGILPRAGELNTDGLQMDAADLQALLHVDVHAWRTEVGAIADYLPFAPDVLLACIDKRFARKGEKVVEANRHAFAAGRDAVAKQLAATPA